MGNKSNLVYETQESLYQRAVQKMEADELIVQYEYKVQNYLKAAEMFEEVGEYEDAPQKAAECRRLAEKTKEDEKARRYNVAVYQMENAKTVKGFEKAEKLFEEAGEYKDSQARITQCRDKAEALNRRRKVKRVIKTVIAIAVIIVVIFAIKASPIPSIVAELAGMKIEDPRTAVVPQETEAASPETEVQTPQEQPQETETQSPQEQPQENVSLADAQPGDQVSFGNHVWYVLDRNGDELKMIMFQAEKFEEFRHTPFNAEQTDVDWERSSLREWMNSAFLEENFSEEERAKILQVSVVNEDNPEYGTDGGNDTQDYAYLLSGEEVEQYKDILSHIRMNMWLRTPGNSPDTASFMSSTTTVMYYGYPVSDTNFYTCPVIHVSTAD